MRNYLTSGGLLEQVQQDFDDTHVGVEDRYKAQESVLPFKPTNAQELTLMQRTMIPAGVDANGIPMFRTHEQAMYQQNKQELIAKQQTAKEAVDRKLNNPFFKATDAFTDLLRNTVGAPLNFLTDGSAFQSDPSKTLVEGYKGRLQELSSLQEMNLKYFQDGREARAEAFDTAVTNRLNKSRSGVSGINDITPSHYTVESIATYQKTGDFNDLVRYDSHRRLKDANGVIHVFDKITNQYLGTDVDAQQIGQDASTIDRIQKLNAKRVEFSLGFGKQYARLREMKAKKVTLEESINEAISLVRGNEGLGWESLLKVLPETDANRLKQILSTIKSNVAFDRLQEMRDNSVTGGALGNVSELEIQLLMDSLAPLGQEQSADELLKSLNSVLRKSHEYFGLAEEGFLEQTYQYGGDREQSKIGDDGRFIFPEIKIGGKAYQNLPELGGSSANGNTPVNSVPDPNDEEVQKVLRFIEAEKNKGE